MKELLKKKWQNDEQSEFLAKCRKMSILRVRLTKSNISSSKKVIGWGSMLGQWVEIAEFPGYSVSDTGMVRNDETGYLMSRLANQGGVVHVGLTKNRVLYKRALAALVANAFIPKPDPERFSGFDTPINLDGNRFNNHVHNLMWRPRWYAIKYFQQFQQDGPSIGRPIEVIETRIVFRTSWEAATTLGVFDREIAISVMTQNYVWPLFQRFRLLQ